MRAIVFDLDGTLVDSAPDLHAAANRMLADLGRGPLSLAAVTGFVGNGVPTLVARCLDATGGADPRGLPAFVRHYNAAPAALTVPYPGVLDLLRRLQMARHPLGLCTNKPAGPAAKVLAAFRMEGYFGAVVGGDTLPVRKPDPAPLLHCLDLLGAAPEDTLYVGDSEVDAATAEAAGIAFALYSGGYRKTEAEAIPASFVFHSFGALEARLVTGVV